MRYIYESKKLNKADVFRIFKKEFPNKKFGIFLQDTDTYIVYVSDKVPSSLSKGRSSWDFEKNIEVWELVADEIYLVDRFTGEYYEQDSNKFTGGLVIGEG